MRSGSDDWFWLSPFVFSAEMRRRRAVTFEHLQPSELDAVVAVRELFRVPPAIIEQLTQVRQQMASFSFANSPSEDARKVLEQLQAQEEFLARQLVRSGHRRAQRP